MLLFTSKGNENIPKGAVVIGEEEAIDHQRALIRDWNKESEVIFLRYGNHMSLGLIMGSSLAIANHFREQFRVSKRLALLAYSPVLFLSLVISSEKYNKRITNNILIMKMKCPLCSQIRYACEQAFIGIVYPTVTGALLMSIAAKKLNTIYIPDLEKDYKEYFRMIFKFIRAGAKKYQVISFLHIFLIVVLPYMQSIEFKNIMKILHEAENIKLNS